eukprot:TRINITY_DN7840_c0_g1_i2.p2 TRINITY_DN7840_c0_g1~~TRINITY_DN7840_c0_g1_i2.p2  ORF type:complete len:110 (-),score=16.89 TRINITY_DN7840_c0_g1_i2:103-432(-)
MDEKNNQILEKSKFQLQLTDFPSAIQLVEGADFFEKRKMEQSYPCTFKYMPPEYYHPNKLTLQYDLWSFGLILFEIFFQLPFQNVQDVRDSLQQNNNHTSQLILSLIHI